MNNRHIIVALTICAVGLISIMVWPEILAMIFVLVFMGVVPGTAITLPSWVSLGVLTILFVMGIRWVLDEPVYRPQATTKDLARRATARRKVTKHTRRTVARRAPARKPARAKA